MISIHYQDEGFSILTLILNDSPHCKIHTSIFSKRPAFKKSYPDIESFEEAFDQLEKKGALSFSLRELSKQALLSASLARRLRKRLLSEQNISYVLQYCIDKGFINDSLWVESFTRFQRKKGRSSRWIEQNLLSKACSPELLDQALLCEEENEKAFAFFLSKEKKKGRSKEAILRSAQRAGFPSYLLSQSLDSSFLL